MGYRSDVAFGVGFRSRGELIGFLTALKLTADLDDFLTDLSVIRSGDVWLLHGEYEDIKWYDGYSEVTNTEKLLLGASERGHSTAFIRVGEETNDITEDYHEGGVGSAVWMWDYYRVERCLNKPLTHEIMRVKEMLRSDLRA